MFVLDEPLGGNPRFFEAKSIRIAYFSMEVALDPFIPTYSGGLGVLAGDTLRSAADLGLPMVAVTLVHRGGYFDQVLDRTGRQSELPEPWDPSRKARAVDCSTSIVIEGRTVRINAWKYEVHGTSGQAVSVLLLDTDCPENDVADRALTNELYGGDRHYRLCQEAALGMGGLQMLRRLGYCAISTFHLNEGHTALLALGLLEEKLAVENRAEPTETDIRDVRKAVCVYDAYSGPRGA